MPLSLGVRRNSKIKIGGQPVRDAKDVIVAVKGGKTLTVLEVFNEGELDIMIEGKTYRITNEARTEILPNVFVSAGKDPNPDHSYDPLSLSTRLAFEAPWDVNINRVPRPPR